MSHICKYSQQLFKNQNKTGKKEFGILTDVQDFRIMATALVRCDKEFLVAFGTSSGQLILERLDIKAKQLTQVDVKQHQAAMLSMKRIQLDGMSPMIACGFTDGSVLLYSIDKINDSYTATLLDAQKDVHGFGVNCIDTVILDEHRFLIASGGDDQNISLMLMEKKGTKVGKIGHCTKYAHSSSVKGLVMFVSEEGSQ